MRMRKLCAPKVNGLGQAPAHSAAYRGASRKPLKAANALRNSPPLSAL